MDTITTVVTWSLGHQSEIFEFLRSFFVELGKTVAVFYAVRGSSKVSKTLFRKVNAAAEKLTPEQLFQLLEKLLSFLERLK